MTPTPEEIRPALEKILKSESFANSQRHKSFLRFIVEETLAGRGDRIKGFTIAIEVFGKPSDFDAQKDPYVRVEAGRLRKRLTEYYRSEGIDDRLRITLNPGSYMPHFSRVETESPTARIPYREASRLWSPLVAAVLLIASATVVAYWLYRANIEAQIARGEPPTIGIYVFEGVGESEFANFATGLHTGILEMLDRYGTVWGSLHVFAVDRSEAINNGVEFDYFLDGTVARFGDSVDVTARLIDGSSEEQLWSGSFAGVFDLTRAFDLQDRLSTEIANNLREPFGPLADAEAQKINGLPVDSLSAYQCNVLFLVAVDEFSRAARDSAKSCLERHNDNDDLDATGLAALSFLYHLDYDDGLDYLNGQPPAADAAYAAAERAINRDSNDIMAQMAMAFVQLAAGRPDQALASIESLMGGNPPTATLGIAYLLLTKLGEGVPGLELFLTASRQSSRPTPSLYFGPVLNHLERGEFEQAQQFAKLIQAPDFLMFQVIGAALEANLNEMDQAQALIDQIYMMHPDFPDYGRELIGRWALPPRAEERVIEGLEMAGMILR